MNDGGPQDVFDVADWLDRASGRMAAPAPSDESAPPGSSYHPRHRADVPVDSFA